MKSCVSVSSAALSVSALTIVRCAVLCCAVLSAVVCSAGWWQCDSGPPSSCVVDPPLPRLALPRPSPRAPAQMSRLSCKWRLRFSAARILNLLFRRANCWSGSRPVVALFFAAITVELFRALFRWSTNCTSLFFRGWGGGVDWVSMHAFRLQQLLWWREQATILRMFKQFLFISALSQTSVQLGPPKNLAFPGFAGRSSARFGKLLDHYSPRSERMLFFNNLCIWSHIYLHGKWQQALWDHFGGSMKSFLLSNILKKIAFRWHKDAQLLKIK